MEAVNESGKLSPFECIGKRCIHRGTKQKGMVVAVGWTPNHAEVQFDGEPSTKTVSMADIMVSM